MRLCGAEGDDDTMDENEAFGHPGFPLVRNSSESGTRTKVPQGWARLTLYDMMVFEVMRSSEANCQEVEVKPVLRARCGRNLLLYSGFTHTLSH